MIGGSIIHDENDVCRSNPMKLSQKEPQKKEQVMSLFANVTETNGNGFLIPNHESDDHEKK